jgi:hypothetical protein
MVIERSQYIKGWDKRKDERVIEFLFMTLLYLVFLTHVFMRSLRL